MNYQKKITFSKIEYSVYYFFIRCLLSTIRTFIFNTSVYLSWTVFEYFDFFVPQTYSLFTVSSSMLKHLRTFPNAVNIFCQPFTLMNCCECMSQPSSLHNYTACNTYLYLLNKFFWNVF